MSVWDNQPVYRGRAGDFAKLVVFAEGPESCICIRTVDRSTEESATIAMTADQAEEFARALLDAAMSLQEEMADG